MMTITTNIKSGASRKKLGRLAAFALVGLLAGTSLSSVSASAAPFSTDAGAPAWSPTATERLVKLPSAYLNKAVERDYKDSALASAIGSTNGNIQAKAQTLKELQASMDRAEGEVLTELKHQFLAEKQAYIRLLGDRQDMNRKRLKTKVKVYEKILHKLGMQGVGSSAGKAQLLARQESAGQRFEGALDRVDMKVFGSGMAPESKYSAEYAKNVAAIERLTQTLKSHAMNAEAEVDGKPLSKKDYLRGLVANAESELAIVDQEDSILGYMAKLVALDAMALAANLDDVADVEDGNDAVSVSAAVDFFAAR